MSDEAKPYTAEEARGEAADWRKTGYRYTDPISRKRIAATLRAYADQGGRIAELERLRTYWNDVAIDLGAQLHESDKANAALTAQLGTVVVALKVAAMMCPICAGVVDGPRKCHNVACVATRRTLAALGVAQDGATERAHICGDPNDACDNLCWERAYVAAQKVQKERKARDAKEGQDG